MMKRFLLSLIILHISLFTLHAQNRGIGRYPGAPEAYFGPVPSTSNTTMRNLALHRAAWASSAADYNMTAHLVTDGICDELQVLPLEVSTPEGVLTRREAEWAIDGGPFSNQILTGARTWIKYRWGEGVPFTARFVELDARVAYHEEQATQGFRIVCQVSEDGESWTTVGELAGKGLPGTAMRYKLQSDPNKQTTEDYLPARVLEEERIALKLKNEKCGFFRLLLEMPGAAYWQLNDIHFFDDAHQELWMQPSQVFRSAWMSDGGGKQWLKVDLGAPATIDHITPRWLEEPKRWHSEVSDDGRYVTLIMEEPNESGYYALRELEVWGTGGVTYAPHDMAGVKGNRLELSGGRWQLQRASEVTARGEEIATEGYDSSSWIWATVPGTVLMSYVNIGAVPDPNYADWVDQISESFFRSNFWYRDVFEVSLELLKQGKLRRLHFDGINWKANVFLNGHRLGCVEGAFRRGEFDVSGLLHEGTNVLAVEIICNEHFGVVKEKNENTTQFNGGILGADNPTFHATIGWDWITTVRGRNAGIWNEVYVTSDTAVTLSDPYVRTEVKGDQVTVTPSVFVRNHGSQPFRGTLSGWIGDVRFEKSVSLLAHHEEEITFAPSDFPQLTRSDFRLWWPNGYGEAYRYDCGYEMRFPVVGATGIAAKLAYKSGLREMTYEHLNDSVLIYVNGRRFVPLGGNWGFDEHNLCYRSREYLTAVAYHRDMHCTMIRNWVGMIGDDAFYEACDSLGMMIWQDFWLANPCDGPDPYNEALFLDNAEDYVRRIRQHASIGIFCGRNEGYPPATLDRQLRRYVRELTPGMAYISSSADDGVTGHGPYCAQPAKVYFEKQSGKLHTERGMPAVMNIESLSRTFSADALWPQSKQWGQHDYTLLGAQRAQEFNGLVEKAFGASTSAAQFARRAQLINYEGYRAMFESTSRARAGLLIWMSHSCWPSMVWQTYDYYFEPTAAYFGVKKACEPLHIQLNALTDSIEVVNLCAGNRTGLTASAMLYDLNGKRLWQKTAKVDSRDDSTIGIMKNEGMKSEKCVLLRLQLKDKKGVISENDYILRDEEGKEAPLGTWPAADVEQQTVVTGTSAVVTLRNRGRAIAPLVRLNLKGADGEQILPVLYSDNYFNLLPGERRTVTITWKAEDARGQQPVVEVETLERP